MVTDSVPAEALTRMGGLLAKMLSAIHGALIEQDADAYSSIALNGREMGIASDIVLLFALAGPSYTPENLKTVGCPFCHRPADIAKSSGPFVEAHSEPTTVATEPSYPPESPSGARDTRDYGPL